MSEVTFEMTAFVFLVNLYMKHSLWRGGALSTCSLFWLSYTSFVLAQWLFIGNLNNNNNIGSCNYPYNTLSRSVSLVWTWASTLCAEGFVRLPGQSPVEVSFNDLFTYVNVYLACFSSDAPPNRQTSCTGQPWLQFVIHLTPHYRLFSVMTEHLEVVFGIN